MKLTSLDTEVSDKSIRGFTGKVAVLNVDIATMGTTHGS